VVVVQLHGFLSLTFEGDDWPASRFGPRKEFKVLTGRGTRAGLKVVTKAKFLVRYESLTMMTKTTAVRDTLKMEAVSSFETPIHFYQATGDWSPSQSKRGKKV
jgi:hypothetical protein